MDGNGLNELLGHALDVNPDRDDAEVFQWAVKNLSKAQLITIMTPLGAQQVWRLRMDRAVAAADTEEETGDSEETPETEATEDKPKARKTKKPKAKPGEVYIDLTEAVLNEPYILRGDIVRLRHMTLADLQEARKGLTLKKRDIERQGRLLAQAIQTLKANTGARTLDDVLAERTAAA